MAIEITNTDDVIDIRDVIARAEELSAQKMDSPDEWSDGDESELKELVALLGACKGMGGDHQWQGVWYPVTLIHDRYFTEYTEDMLKDCGVLPRDVPWYIVIDWEATANNVRQDYTSVDFDGQTYWVR